MGSLRPLTRCSSRVRTEAGKRASFVPGKLCHPEAVISTCSKSPDSPARVGLNEYMASLKRIDRTLSQMTASNMRVNQPAISDFNDLLNEGGLKLQELFRAALVENNQPVEPLNYLTKRKYINRRPVCPSANGKKIKRCLFLPFNRIEPHISRL